MTTSGKGRAIQPAEGKLGILLPGMGAVATTFVAGVEAIRTGLSKPIGSLTQMGTVRLGKRTDNRSPLIKDFVPLAGLDDIVFGGWDIYTDNAYVAAKKAGVLDNEHLADAQALPGDSSSRWPAVFDPQYVKRLHGDNVKTGKNKRDLADQVHADIEKFKKDNGLSRWSWSGAARPRSTGKRATCTPRSEVRKGARGEPSRHPALDDLRLLRDQGGHSLRERGAEPLRRFPGHARARQRTRGPRSPGRTSRPARPS